MASHIVRSANSLIECLPDYSGGYWKSSPPAFLTATMATPVTADTHTGVAMSKFERVIPLLVYEDIPGGSRLPGDGVRLRIRRSHALRAEGQPVHG